MRLAIVIVTYNGMKWIERTLDSCFKCAQLAPVYVVDNNSTDGSADFIAQTYPSVKLFKQEKNLGFAGGNNIGLKAALASGAEAVFLLNQDAELHLGTLDELARYLTLYPKVGAVQPAIILPDGKVNSLGNSFHYLGLAEAWGLGLSMPEAIARVTWLKEGEPPYVSGAAVLLRSSALNQVGFFNDELFMYHEDLELSFRMRFYGWSLAVEPAAYVTHYYEPSRSLKQFYYMERNRFIVWLLYFKWPTLVLLFMPWLASELMLLLTSLTGGWFGVKLKSYVYFLHFSNWRYLFKRRRKLQTVRQLTDRELLSLATSKIEFHSDGSQITKYLFNPLSTLVWKIIYPLIRW